MTISSVQANSGSATANSTFTISTTSNLTQGNLLIACMSEGNSLAFSAPAGWTLCTTQATQSGSLQVAMAWIIVTAGMAGATLSASFSIASGSHSVAWTVREWNSSTGWQTTPADKQNEASAATSTVATGSTSTTTAAVELVVAALGWVAGSSATFSALTAGYSDSLGQVNNSTNNAILEAYLTTSSTGAQACQATLSGAEANGGVIATFKPVAITYVGGSTSIAAALSGLTQTNTYSSTTGNTLVVVCSAYQAGNTAQSLVSVSDSTGTNVWTVVQGTWGYYTSSNYSGACAVAFCVNATAVSSVTIHWSAIAGTNSIMQVLEFAGVPAGAGLDGSASTSYGGTAETSLATPSITPTAATDIIIGNTACNTYWNGVSPGTLCNQGGGGAGFGLSAYG